MIQDIVHPNCKCIVDQDSHTWRLAPNACVECIAQAAQFNALPPAGRVAVEPLLEDREALVHRQEDFVAWRDGFAERTGMPQMGPQRREPLPTEALRKERRALVAQRRRLELAEDALGRRYAYALRRYGPPRPSRRGGGFGFQP